MAKVNIFVSSTCYDLSQIRNDIKKCIEDMGHNPILSELKDFPVDPLLTNAENCINAVNKEADIFVLIIGNHYGSVLESGKSITNVEFQAAVNKGIPIYTFALKQMTNILPVWEKNPDVDYSHIVDNKKVFEFLADVRNKSGFWNFEFEKAEDITGILKAQLSNLFHDALIAKKTIERSDIKGLYDKISSKALDILIKKETAYEIRFLMQSMKDELYKYSDLQSDYMFSMMYKSLTEIENINQFKKWASHKVRELQNITISIDRLNYAVNKTFENPNESHDIDVLYYVSRTYARIYASILEWGIEANSTIAPVEYSKVMHGFASLPDKIIERLEKYPEESLIQIDKWISCNKTGGNIYDVIKTLKLDLDVDKDAVNQFLEDCNKAF